MLEIIKSGEKIAEGKTKIIWAVRGRDDLVIVQNKMDITKNDDKTKTQIMKSKDLYATETTCAIFNLLKQVGIPVAYERRYSESEFLAKKTNMIMLELVGRRYAVGSFLKRSPNFKTPKGMPPHRFHTWKFELFLKTTEGRIIDREGNHIGDMCKDILVRDREKPIDDPFIFDPFNELWRIHHPKIPTWDEENSYLNKGISSLFILPDGVSVKKLEEILKQTALVLEGAFAQFGIRFIDFKIEFGITSDGKLLVSDVIDNDSWRLKDSDWNELSKQLFRDNADMDFISAKYSFVAKLVQNFRIPRQVIVLWKETSLDSFPEIPDIAGVDKIELTLSGYKTPHKCMDNLENILAEYPEGGVIITFSDMSNGLGSIIAARTSWPVISVKSQLDVWNSLESLSNVPLLTVFSFENAVLAALNILAQKNPAAYMVRQLEIEKLDY